MAYSSLHHTNRSGESLFAVLSLSVLESLDADRTEALRSISIRTISDLLHYVPIHNAQLLMRLAIGDIGHDTSAEFLLDTSFLSRSREEYPNLPIVAVEGVGDFTADVFESAFGVTTLADLASFEPFLEAQRYLKDDDEVFNEPASAPPALLPKILGNTSTRATLSDFVKSHRLPSDVHLTSNFSDSELVLAFATKRRFRRRESGGFIEGISGGRGGGGRGLFESIEEFFGGSRGGEEESGDEVTTQILGRSGLHLGYIVSYTQTWTNAGTHLGEILHSLALAPGESRNIAIIEWYRRQVGERNEETGSSERLSNRLVYARALSEVVHATATEHLEGYTETHAKTESLAKSRSFGVSGSRGLQTGAEATVPVKGVPVSLSAAQQTNLAGNASASRVYANNEQTGTLKTESTGTRDLLSETIQNIRDTTAQFSEHYRSLWSSVVITDEQTEREEALTRNVTNYNHSHALTIQYYEVIQKYLTETAVDRTIPVLWIPFRAFTFSLSFIREQWPILGELLRETNPELYEDFSYFIEENQRRATFEDDFKPDFSDNENLGLTFTKMRVSLSDASADLIFEGIRDQGAERNKQWLGISNVTLDINNQQDGYTTSLNDADNKQFDINKSISDIRRLSYVVDISGVGNLARRASNATGSLRCRIKIVFDAKDKDGNFASVVYTKELRESFSKGDLRRVRGGRFRVRGVWDNAGEPGFRNQLKSLIEEEYNYRDDREQERRLRQIRERVLSHFQARRYFYTQYLVARLEKLQLVEFIEQLTVEQGEITDALTDYIDPVPVAISDNLMAFRLIEPAPDASILTDEIAGFRAGLKESLPESETGTVFLPTAGVFAEAILGRSNASEFTDLRRFWNWQDSPIPHHAPQIQPVELGIDRYRDILDGLEPTQQDAVLELLEGAKLPAPATAAVLETLQQLSLQDNGTGAEALASVLTGLTELASSTSETASKLSGDAANQASKQAADLGKRVTDLAGTMAKSVTERGAEQRRSERSNGTSSGEDGSHSGGQDGSDSKNSDAPSGGTTPNAGHVLWLSRDPGQQEILLYNFPIGRPGSTLHPEHARVLRKISKQIRGVADITLVEGRASATVTDSDEEARTNESISIERMTLVWEELLRFATLPDEQSNIDKQRFVGATDPIRKKFPSLLASIPEGRGLEDPAERSVLVRLGHTVSPNLQRKPVPGTRGAYTEGHTYIIHNTNIERVESLVYQDGVMNRIIGDINSPQKEKVVNGDVIGGDKKVINVDNDEGQVALGSGSSQEEIVNFPSPDDAGKSPEVTLGETKAWRINFRNSQSEGFSLRQPIEDIKRVIEAFNNVSQTLPNFGGTITIPIPKIEGSIAVTIDGTNPSKTFSEAVQEISKAILDSNIVGNTLKGLVQGRVAVDMKVYPVYDGKISTEPIDVTANGEGLHYLRNRDNNGKIDGNITTIDYESDKPFRPKEWGVRENDVVLYYRKGSILEDIVEVAKFVAAIIELANSVLPPSMSDAIKRAIEGLEKFVKTVPGGWVEGDRLFVFDPEIGPERQYDSVTSGASVTAFLLDGEIIQ